MDPSFATDTAGPHRRFTLYGVALGQRFSEVRAASGGEWTENLDAEHGRHLFRTPNALNGTPGIILASGDSLSSDPRVRYMIVFAMRPDVRYLSPETVIPMLEMVWGTAVQFRGAENDRLWVDTTLGLRARLRFRPSDTVPNWVLTVDSLPMDPSERAQP